MTTREMLEKLATRYLSDCNTRIEILSEEDCGCGHADKDGNIEHDQFCDVNEQIEHWQATKRMIIAECYTVGVALKDMTEVEKATPPIGKTLCKTYLLDEVLPDENNHCSLCGGVMNKHGECLGKEDRSMSYKQAIAQDLADEREEQAFKNGMQ